MEIFVWPAVVLIFGIVFIFAFWKPIARLIDRTTHVSKKGIQAGSQLEQKADPPQSKVDDVLKTYDSQLLVESEKLIQAHLDSLHPKDAAEREKFFLRGFATLAIIWSFDKAYYLIYGSQIAALHFLNDNRNSPLTTNHILPFYEDGVKKSPTIYASYTFEGWITFLVTSNLVQRNGNDVGITIRGKEFLKYLVEQGYPINKLG